MTTTKIPATAHHELAAQHHEAAALHHRSAIKLLNEGQPDQAATHALRAHGHLLHAGDAGAAGFKTQTGPMPLTVQAAPAAPAVG